MLVRNASARRRHAVSPSPVWENHTASSEIHVVNTVAGGGQFIISEGRATRVGRLVLASCEAFDNFPPKPARPGVTLCRLPGGTRAFMWLMSTQLFRHGDRGYGSLTKRRIPDEVLDDWFGPATRSAAIRYDLRKFTAGTRRARPCWTGRRGCRRSRPGPGHLGCR